MTVVVDWVLKNQSCTQTAETDWSRPRAEIAVLVGPPTAIVFGPIEFCLSILRRAGDYSRDEPTDDVVMSITSR